MLVPWRRLVSDHCKAWGQGVVDSPNFIKGNRDTKDVPKNDEDVDVVDFGIVN